MGTVVSALIVDLLGEQILIMQAAKVFAVVHAAASTEGRSGGCSFAAGFEGLLDQATAKDIASLVVFAVRFRFVGCSTFDHGAQRMAVHRKRVTVP
jgi:hypothetical protein